MGVYIVRRQLRSLMLMSSRKATALLILCLITLLSACGGQNEGMQTLASREVPYFYAVGNDPVTLTQAYLIVGNTEGYYREYMIPGYTTITGQAGMCVGKSGRVYIGETNIVYTSSSEDYSSWSSQTIGATFMSFAATPSGDFLLRNNVPTPVLYLFEKGSNSWVDAGKTTTLSNAVSKCCYSSSYYKLLVLGTDGADTYIQELTTATALNTIAYYPFIDTVNLHFFAEVGGGYYIGNSTQGLFLNGVLIGPEVDLYSFAVVSPSEIFAANNSMTLPLCLLRLRGGIFVPELIFSSLSASGNVVLWPAPPDHVIIGINDTTDIDGLYLYDFRKFSLKKLNSMPIYAVYSRTP